MVGYRRRRRTYRRCFRRRPTRARRFIRRRYGKRRSLKLFETKCQQYDLTSGSFNSIGHENWSVSQIFNPSSDLANAAAVEGREFYPLRIYSKNATLTGGQGASSTSVNPDDQYNNIRIVIFSTTQATVDSTNLSSVQLDTPFSTRYPLLTNPNLTGLRVHYDKFIRTKANFAMGAGEYTANLYPVYINIKLPLRKHYKNPNGTWSRTYWIAALSDSLVIPNPGFITGRLLCTWKDP